MRGTAVGALLLLLLGAGAATSQSTITLSDLHIDVWPDYDRPGVLVIYRATLAPDTTRPARLEFRIPASAGLPSAVAEAPPGGQLTTLQYVRTIDGDTALIELTASQPRVQLEYYDPLIARDGANRSFSFAWHGDFAVEDFEISLQQPHLAQNFTTVPEAPVAAASGDGLVYHSISRVGVAQGEVVQVGASYEKASDQLSVETMAPVSTPPASASAPTPVTGEAAAPAGGTGPGAVWALLAAVAAVVAVLVFRARRQAGNAEPPTRSGRAIRSESSGEEEREFCTQCGSGVIRGDRYCRSCGAPLTG